MKLILNVRRQVIKPIYKQISPKIPKLMSITNPYKNVKFSLIFENQIIYKLLSSVKKMKENNKIQYTNVGLGTIRG